VEGYYDTLLAMFDHSVAEGFLKPEYTPIVLASKDPEDLVAKMQAYRAPVLDKWIGREET
jgi:predicted Rossmann-fold nucleotide-binding protein